MNYEHSNNSVYTSLQYYNNPGMGVGVVAPVPSGSMPQGVQIVPQYGSMGYDSLTGGSAASSNKGYFTISSAYGSYPNCGTFVARQC